MYNPTFGFIFITIEAYVLPTYGQGLVLAIYGFIVAGFGRQIIKEMN